MEFFDPIIDFLGEQTGPMQNWSYVYTFVGLLLAAAAARESARRWRKLKRDHDDSMQDKPLTAVVLSTKEGREIRYDASIAADGGCYRLTITRTDGSKSEEITNRLLGSLDDVESHLRANTAFILADFK